MKAQYHPPTTVGPMLDLTHFQRDLLVVAAGLDEPSGQDIADELAQYYGEEIRHGRLYPALDTLVNEGLLGKEEVDGRTNAHPLTDRGRRAIQTRCLWMADQLEADDE